MSQREALPGRDESLWLATTGGTDYPALDGDLRVDTAVVGGGIVGVTAAVNCKEAERSVALVEKNRIVEGVTGHTTAKLTSQHGLKYRRLVESFGHEKARQYARANADAIGAVASRVEERGVDCDFGRLPAYAYAPDRREMKREASAARAVDLPAAYVPDAPHPAENVGAVKFTGQAHFHPRKYLLDLAEAIPGDGSHVFEETKVTDVVEEATGTDVAEGGDGAAGSGTAPCRVETERGTITADNVVLATHFPIEDPALYFARMYPKRSYVLSVRLAGEGPEGMFYRDESPYFSVRPHPADDVPLTLIGGQNHKTGQGGSTAERYRRLERQAREHFDVESVEYRWSTQDYVSADGVPFVGELGPGYDRVYAATGFGGWGMSNGVAAGRMLAAFAQGETAENADVFDPGRVTPKASAATFLEENVDAGSHFVGDWVAALLDDEEGTIAPGEGEVVRRGGRPLAVARDEDGDLHVRSAVCSHMHCIVRWNDAEGSWDCPCHGSRFSVDGEVLDGPAVEDLSRRGG